MLGCSDVPSADTRPFTVGGFIPIWRALDDMAFCPLPGEVGKDIDTEPEVEESLHSFVLNVMTDPRALMKLAASMVPDVPESHESTTLLSLSSYDVTT